MEIIISSNKSFIAIQVNCPDEKPLSWEQLQQIKDYYYPELDFIEVYPTKQEIINKANVRHLVHIIGFNCPKMQDLEMECNIEIIEEPFTDPFHYFIPNLNNKEDAST